MPVQGCRTRVQLGENRPSSRFRRMRLSAGSGRGEPTDRQCAQTSDCDQVATATMHHSARQPDRATSPAATPSDSGVEDPRSAGGPTNANPAVEDQPDRLNRRADSENPGGRPRHATDNAGSKGVGPRPQNDHEAAAGVRPRECLRTTSRVRDHSDPRRRSGPTPTNLPCRFNRTRGQPQDHASHTGPVTLSAN